jgi:hypothetical protein
VKHFRTLPDETFAVSLPPDVRHQVKEVTVPDTAIGALAMPGHGLEVPGLGLEEAGRQLVTEMWNAVVKSDFGRFRKLCPIAAGFNDELLEEFFGNADADRVVIEVLDVQPGVLRGHSSLGPLSVVSSHVRRRDGSVYEDKVIVQHLVSRPTPTCVIYSGYGRSYRLK